MEDYLTTGSFKFGMEKEVNQQIERQFVQEPEECFRCRENHFNLYRMNDEEWKCVECFVESYAENISDIETTRNEEFRCRSCNWVISPGGSHQNRELGAKEQSDEEFICSDCFANTLYIEDDLPI